MSGPPGTVPTMNAIALLEPDFEADRLLGGDTCRDCRRFLDDAAILLSGKDNLCADCADLAAHGGECRDCGNLLRDTEVDAGSCSDCLG